MGSVRLGFRSGFSPNFTRSGWKRLGIVALLLGCGWGLWGLWGLHGRRDKTQAAPLLPALPQDPNIQVYFNHSGAAAYTEPYRQQYRLGDNLEQVVIEAIAAAQTSIDLAVHELNLPQVAMALSQKHQAGVKVRVLVENTYRQPLSLVLLVSNASTTASAKNMKRFLPLLTRTRIASWKLQKSP
jgi:phosphatidylserine/phosphatidylglycerophosphate/cardiolipin synthase-like enzyme